MLDIAVISYLIATYLIAAIPFGLVLSKLFSNKDIRKLGSNNIGATNVARILGKKLGFVTLILDGLKGAIMVIIASVIFANHPNLSLIIVLTAFISVIGHVFPIYLKFKGGKGVATSIAVILAVNPVMGLVVIISWIAVYLITKISAIASLLSIFFVSLYSLYEQSISEETILYLSILILVVIRHKENLIRLKNGKENKV